MNRAAARIGALLGILLALLVVVSSTALANAKPPDDPVPAELKDKQWGIDKKTGEYCDTTDPDPKKRRTCRNAKDCEIKGQVCDGKGGDIKDELKAIRNMRDEAPDFFRKKGGWDWAEKCVRDGDGTAAECYSKAMDKFGFKFKFKKRSVVDFVVDKVSDAAADALEEAAAKLGQSVVWLLQEFAIEFNDDSTISLNKTGLGLILGVTTAMSALVATFLLLVQFAKLAVSQRGGPLVTAITGLAKWGVILGVYLFATQVALNWSDAFSTALVNETFAGGGEGEEDATKIMQQRLGEMFSGLIGGGGSALIAKSGVGTVSAVGFVIVISILCILAVGALWVEILIRQAGIIILVSVMPIALAGQVADSTREWWPKARDALIALILMKPAIVICFSIGFGVINQGEGVRNVLVGLLIFIIAGLSWPTLARFITFTGSGGGSGTGSGMLSSVGSSVSSMFGGNQSALGGPGMAGGGSAYTKALESDNDRSAGGSGSGRGFWSKATTGKGAGSTGSKLNASVGTGLQLAAVGKDTLESATANVAAYAGLGQGSPGGRHGVTLSPSGEGDAAPAAPEASPPRPTPSSPPDSPPPAPAPRKES
ncbi:MULTISPECIES: hypothetical protein [Streptomyces]|nr:MULTISPECIES: hypothetical protein [Streptomyces]